LGLAGQPGIVTTGVSANGCGAPTAPVGLGSAAGRPPNEAQLPMAKIPSALAAVVSRISLAVRPAILQ